MINLKLKPEIFSKLSLFFFYLFILTLPFNFRLIAYKGPTDFISLFLYLGDFLLILALFFWVLRKFQEKSLFEGVNLKYQPLLILLFLLLFWQMFSMAKNGFSYYSFLSISRVIIGVLLFCYILADISKKKQVFFVIKIILFLALLESVLGIYQFGFQKSLGIPFGAESIIGPNLEGVAKISLESGEKIVRAYATFSHPNVFSGFLLISFYLLAIFWCYSEIWIKKPIKNKFFPQILFAVFSLILAISLLFTFSRTTFLVILGIFLVVLIKWLVNNWKTWNLFKICPLKCGLTSNCKIFKIIVIGVLILVIFGSFELLSSRFLPSKISSEDLFIKDRIFYQQIALKMIEKAPIFGIGPGLFPLALASFSKEPFYPWQLQPVHNVYLLMAAENGLPGLFIFLLFIFIYLRIMFHVEHSGEKNGIMFHPAPFTKVHPIKFASQLFNRVQVRDYRVKHFSFVLGVFSIGIFAMMLFDHYFWTINSINLILWLTLALFLKIKEVFEKE